MRRALDALIEHDTKAEGKNAPQRGFDAVVRELTYTLVNRLVGLKVMEARNLLRLRPPGSRAPTPRPRPPKCSRPPSRSAPASSAISAPPVGVATNTMPMPTRPCSATASPPPSPSSTPT